MIYSAQTSTKGYFQHTRLINYNANPLRDFWGAILGEYTE
jgi:hypothetical protein